VTALFSDRKYFKRVPPGSLAEKLTFLARDRIYTGFMRLCAPAKDAAILDVGVSSFPHPAANVLERKYPFASRLTAAGMGKGDGFREMFPQVRYVQLAPDGPLHRPTGLPEGRSVCHNCGNRFRPGREQTHRG